MLTTLMLLGFFGGEEIEAGTGPLIATAERRVAAARVQPVTVIGNAIPLGAYVWPQAYDPGDHAPYAFNFGALLGEEESIAAIDMIAMSSQAASLGVQVDQEEPFGPIITEDGKHVQVWFVVDPSLQLSSQFDATGVRLPVTFRITTDATPPERYERTGVLVVRQQ